MTQNLSLQSFRKKIRTSEYFGHTSGIYNQFAQANIVILKSDEAEDFEEFCRLNPKPCPVIFRSRPGEPLLSKLGDIDIRTDVPGYNIYENGELRESVNDIKNIWSDDMVCFCIGCSFTFDRALVDSGVELKHVSAGNNVAMYRTKIPVNSSKLFSGNLVVSARWIPEDQVEKAERITANYPDFHGEPVHKGNPSELGIVNMDTPDYGDFTPPEPSTVPMFWACGVTPQNCLAEAKLPLVITHKPGHMLITDLTHREAMELASQ